VAAGHKVGGILSVLLRKGIKTEVYREDLKEGY
jgi:hypothetical protein